MTGLTRHGVALLRRIAYFNLIEAGRELAEAPDLWDFLLMALLLVLGQVWDLVFWVHLVLVGVTLLLRWWAIRCGSCWPDDNHLLALISAAPDVSVAAGVGAIIELDMDCLAVTSQFLGIRRQTLHLRFYYPSATSTTEWLMCHLMPSRYGKDPKVVGLTGESIALLLETTADFAGRCLPAVFDF